MLQEAQCFKVLSTLMDLLIFNFEREQLGWSITVPADYYGLKTFVDEGYLYRKLQTQLAQVVKLGVETLDSKSGDPHRSTRLFLNRERGRWYAGRRSEVK